MILQACTSCDRQYDVTHLALESRVRCVCNVVLTVRRPKELTVRARKCSNCGGRVEPGEEACGYCASELLVPDLSSTLCPRCFKRIEVDARHCAACGVAIAPQGLTPIPDGTVCPRCQGGLRIRSLGEASVIECTACEGLWVERDDFARICQRAQERPEINLAGAAPKLPVKAYEPERKVRYIPCPTCGELMMRKMFRYRQMPSRVVIDYCREHGVWLDKDELERIVSFVRQRVDVDQPFDVGDALGTSRRAGPRPSPTTGTFDVGDGFVGDLGTILVLDALGDVLGSVLGSIFD
jgi:Zn-finger nucleic acid-binding protein